MKIRYFLILAVSLILSACSDISAVTENFSCNKEYGVIKGSLTENCRTAIPSSGGTDVAYVVTCKSGATITNHSISRTTDYSFNLNAGSYVIEAYGITLDDLDSFNISNLSNYPNLFYGKYASTVSVSNGQQIQIPAFEIRPKVSAGKSGTVNLTVSTNVSSIKAVKYEWVENNSPKSKTAVFTDGKAVIDLLQYGSTVTSGIYKVAFSFYSSETDLDQAHLVYKTGQESVNVYDNLVTDTWLPSNALYLKTGNFIVTQECINAFKHGPDYYVASSGADTNTGTYFDPVGTVQKAIDLINAVNDGTTSYKIIVKDDVTCTTAVTDATYGSSYNSIVPGKNLTLTIQGEGASAVKIAGNSSARVLLASGESNTLNLTLKNIQITGGVLGSGVASTENDSDDKISGGGIFAGNGCNLVLEDCIVGAEQTINGLANTISNEISIVNRALNGSAIYVKDSENSTVSIKNTKIGGCYSRNGGTVYAAGKSFSMDENSEIIGNIACFRGGALFLNTKDSSTVSGTIRNNYSNNTKSVIEIRGTTGKYVDIKNAVIKDNGISVKNESMCALRMSDDTKATVRFSGTTTLDGILNSGTNNKVVFTSGLTSFAAGCKAVFESYDENSVYYVPEGAELYQNASSLGILSSITFTKHSADTSSDTWELKETSGIGKLVCGNNNGGQIGDVTVLSLRGELENKVSGAGLTINSSSGGSYTYKVYNSSTDITSDVKNFNIAVYCDGILLTEDTDFKCELNQAQSEISITPTDGASFESGTTLTVYFTFSYLGVSGYSDSFNLKVN